MVKEIQESQKNYISNEKRCEKCGKLLFVLQKKKFDKIEKSVIIVSRCNRCSCDNYIKI